MTWVVFPCPHCHRVIDTRDVRITAEVEQATAAPGELRTVTRPPAVMPGPEDDGPNAGDEDETGNG